VRSKSWGQKRKGGGGKEKICFSYVESVCRKFEPNDQRAGEELRRRWGEKESSKDPFSTASFMARFRLERKRKREKLSLEELSQQGQVAIYDPAAGGEGGGGGKKGCFQLTDVIKPLPFCIWRAGTEGEGGGNEGEKKKYIKIIIIKANTTAHSSNAPNDSV